MDATYLGIDTGTSGVKTVLTDAQGVVLSANSTPLSVERPHPGWSEQDPRDWWRACVEVVDRIAAEKPTELARLSGIGLCGQMHGATLLDGDGAVLRPAILWNDQRAAAQCAQLLALCPQAPELAGAAPSAGFAAPKLKWLQTYEPDLFARVATVLMPKDYVRFCLSGTLATDFSDASGTYWLDVGRRDWSEALLAASGLLRGQMPKLVLGTEIAGHLKPSLRTRWGVERQDVPIAGGAGDNAGAACGAGVLDEDLGLLSLGTSGVVFVPSRQFTPNSAQGVHTFCHAVAGRWHQMGVVLSATDSLNWWSEVTGKSPADLVGEAEKRVTEAGGLVAEELYAPYLAGDRTPHNDAHARAVFAGLTRQTDRAGLTLAIMSGVAFAFGDCAAALAATGARPKRWLATGGGAQSALWLSLLASVLGKEVAPIAGADHGAALGAARLAICAETGRPPADVMSLAPMGPKFLPDRELEPKLAARYAQYRALYPAAAASGAP